MTAESSGPGSPTKGAKHLHGGGTLARVQAESKLKRELEFKESLRTEFGKTGKSNLL